MKKLVFIVVKNYTKYYRMKWTSNLDIKLRNEVKVITCVAHRENEIKLKKKKFSKSIFIGMHVYENDTKVGNTAPVIFKLSHTSTARVTTHMLAILLNGCEVGIIVGNYRETFPSDMCQKRVLLPLISMLSPLMNARIVYTDSIHLFIHTYSPCPLRYNTTERISSARKRIVFVCTVIILVRWI